MGIWIGSRGGIRVNGGGFLEAGCWGMQGSKGEVYIRIERESIE
jgi:hypothetical protein